DKNGEIKRIEPRSEALKRRRIGERQDFDRRKKERFAPRLADQRREPLGLALRARHDDALAGQRLRRGLHRAARIASAPRSRSCAATRAPRVSGADDSPSPSARAAFFPSGEATTALSDRRAPFISA